MFKRIIVVRLSSAGDVILCTPAVEALRKNFPDAEIDFLVKEEYAPLLLGNPNITRIIPLPNAERGIYSYIRFLSLLRKNNYDLIVDLHKNFRTFLLRLMLSDVRAVVTKKRTLERFLLVHFKRHMGKVKYVCDIHIECLGSLGVKHERIRPKLYLTESELELAREIDLFDVDIVGIHPFARWRNKEWGFERYIELAKRFVDAGFGVLIFACGDSSGRIKFVEPKGWRELMMYISRCALFVGNDSAPVHIANALGVPVVAIFGPTSPEFGFAPFGDDVRIIYSGVQCSPCDFHGKKRCKKGLICMSSIDVDEVFLKGVEILNEREKSGVHRP